jgi:hypothetical protein
MGGSDALKWPHCDALNPMQPPDLRPLLHADHTPSSSPDHTDQASVRTRPDEPTPRQVGHFSIGAGGSVFSRRPQLLVIVSA